MGAGHSHSHGHGHAHGSLKNSRRLAVVLGLVLVYMVAEVVGGLLTNSLALLADAGHMLSDAGALEKIADEVIAAIRQLRLEVAQRTSPTNMGLWLTAALSAQHLVDRHAGVPALDVP